MEEAFGAPRLVDALPTRKGCRISVQQTGGESVEAPERWPEYFAWFEDTQARLRAAGRCSRGSAAPLPPEVLRDLKQF